MLFTSIPGLLISRGAPGSGGQNPPAQNQCPAGYTGTYPNCVAPQGPTGGGSCSSDGSAVASAATTMQGLADGIAAFAGVTSVNPNSPQGQAVKAALNTAQSHSSENSWILGRLGATGSSVDAAPVSHKKVHSGKCSTCKTCHHCHKCHGHCKKDKAPKAPKVKKPCGSCRARR